jgi:hypothetical protein
VQPVGQHFRDQARACVRLGSPFTAMLLEIAADRLDETSVVGSTVLRWRGDPKADALALRFAGSLHALVLSGASPALARVYPGACAETDAEVLWAAVADALDAHEAAVLRFLESPPQTNEVARSAVLLGGFLAIARQTGRPLALLEIGASAGLNLHWDAYAYALGQASWGPATAPLRLEPEWRGPLPALGPVEVRARQGCDRRPIRAMRRIGCVFAPMSGPTSRPASRRSRRHSITHGETVGAVEKAVGRHGAMPSADRPSRQAGR